MEEEEVEESPAGGDHVEENKPLRIGAPDDHAHRYASLLYTNFRVCSRKRLFKAIMSCSKGLASTVTWLAK